MATEDARILRLKAEYRRCGIYVWVGSVVCLVVAIALAPMVQQFHPQAAGRGESALIFGPLIVAATVFWLILRRWRLRVDQEGIARRRLWRWYVWPWEAFRSGAVKQGRFLGYYLWPEAAWTWRGLLLELIEEADAKKVDGLIRRIRVAPPETELPEEVNFRVFRTKVRLHAEGMEVCRGGTERHYTWKDIDRVVIARLEHDRRDFSRLKIQIPDKPIELFLHRGNPNWRGDDTELIGRWFTTYSPSDRVLVVARAGSPRSCEEAEYRLTVVRRDMRKYQLGKRWIAALAVVPFALGFVKPQHFILAALYAILFFAYWRLFDEQQKRSEENERELIDWLASQEDQGADQPEPF